MRRARETLLTEYLLRISDERSEWIRQPLSSDDCTRPGLILYHRGFLKDYFLTDAKGEAALEAGLQHGARSISCRVHRVAVRKQKPTSLFSERNQLANLNIEITNRCTAKCKYCYLGHIEAADDIPTSLLHSVLNQARAMGMRHVTFTGGEPTLDPRLIDITSEMIQSGVTVNILTNGDLLTKELIAKFESIREQTRLYDSQDDLCHACGAQILSSKSNRVVCPTCLSPLQPIIFQVSLDGVSSDIHDHTRGNGSFQRTKDTIRRLVDRGFTVSISQTVNAIVVESDPSEYLDMALALGAKGVRIGLLEWSGRTLECPEMIPDNDSLFYYYRRVLDSLDRINSGGSVKLMVGEISSIRGALANLIPKRGCLFCKAIHLRVDGNLVVCPFCPSPDFDLGNLSTVPLKDALKLKATRAESLATIADFVTTCNDCIFRYVCGGGCRGNAFNTSGKLNGPDPYCGFYRRFFTYVVTTLERFPKSPRNLTYASLKEP